MDVRTRVLLQINRLASWAVMLHCLLPPGWVPPLHPPSIQPSLGMLHAQLLAWSCPDAAHSWRFDPKQIIPEKDVHLELAKQFHLTLSQPSIKGARFGEHTISSLGFSLTEKPTGLRHEGDECITAGNSI